MGERTTGAGGLGPWRALLAAPLAAALAVGCTSELDLDDDDDAGGPPWSGELACEHDYVNERLGGLHYWLADLDADGGFAADFPHTVGDQVTGTFDRDTGALEAVVTFDDAYQVVLQEVSGTLAFEHDGDVTGELTSVLTYLDDFVETQQRTLAQSGCVRTASYTSVDRRERDTAVTVETTFTSAMTADETVSAAIGDEATADYVSELYDDYTRADQVSYDLLDTDQAPDQIIDRVMQADGSGEGTYVTDHGDGRATAGDWSYHRNGSQEGDWEMTQDGAPVNPVAWGHTVQFLDGSGNSDYERVVPGGETIECYSEWGVDGHGATDCDGDEYDEEF